MKNLILFVLIFLIISCSYDQWENWNIGKQDSKKRLLPKLEISPELGIAFDCVTLGCEQQHSILIANRGGGTIALHKIHLKNGASLDFSLVGHSFPSSQKPVLLAALESVEVIIQYRPTDGIDDKAALLIDWKEQLETNQEAILHQKEIPIRTRVLGEKSAKALRSLLNYGYVASGEQKTLYFPIENTSQGNAVVTITPGLKSPNQVFKIAIDTEIHLNPGQKAEVPIVFSPQSEGTFEGNIVFSIKNSDAPQIIAHCLGTSLNQSKVSLKENIKTLDFGSMNSGSEKKQTITLRNEGKSSERLMLTLSDNLLDVIYFENSSSLHEITLAPMETLTLTLVSAPKSGGNITGNLQIKSLQNQVSIELPIYVSSVAPLLEVSNAEIEIPNIAIGWESSTVYISIKNNGTGELVVKEINLTADSSPLLSISDIPSLPFRLQSNSLPMQIGVKLRGHWKTDVSGFLQIKSNSSDNPIVLVPIKGNVLECNEHCRLAHGQANCALGKCEVSFCDKGWHNADNKNTNGCECREDFTSSDVGSNCATGMQLGMLGDNCSNYDHSKEFKGTLHNKDDVDLFYVRFKDEGNLFCDVLGDSFEASVTLTSAPPGLVLCSNVKPFGTGCGGYKQEYDPNLCERTKHKKEGARTSDESSDMTAWLMWHPDAQPVCGEYTILFRSKK